MTGLIQEDCKDVINEKRVITRYHELDYFEKLTFCNYCKNYGICWETKYLAEHNINNFWLNLIDLYSILTTIAMVLLGLYLLRNKKFKMHPYPLLGLASIFDGYLVSMYLLRASECSFKQPMGFIMQYAMFPMLFE